MRWCLFFEKGGAYCKNFIAYTLKRDMNRNEEDFEVVAVLFVQFLL